ncbi:cell division protein ZapA [Tepidimonas charontis]|uniref:cell division protein ZapA n=1 Tax=Tepidimonas charontis TaxID=2267262 RepID=UPI001186F859
MKQVEVQIMSQTYLLACPVDGEEALREAAAKVDAAMCRIRDAGKVKARDRIAVLAALNVAFEASQRDPALVFRNSSFGTPDGSDGVAADGTGAGLPAAAEDKLRTLIARIDAALAADDRLL